MPEAAALLHRHGFVTIADTNAREWTHLGPGSAALARPFRPERLIVAHSSAPSSPTRSPASAD